MRLDRLKGMQIDLVGAALAVIIAAGGYGLYLHAPLSDARMGEPVHRRRVALDQEVASLRQACAARTREIEQARGQLSKLSASLRSPGTIDELLARLDNLASQCGVQIASWQPGGEEQHDQYNTHLYWIQGRASFPDLCQWLALVENGVPLLDVTHFAIRSPGAKEEGTCQFECTLKLYTGWDNGAMEVAVAEP
jgi:hypothetical protein